MPRIMSVQHWIAHLIFSAVSFGDLALSRGFLITVIVVGTNIPGSSIIEIQSGSVFGALSNRALSVMLFSLRAPFLAYVRHLLHFSARRTAVGSSTGPNFSGIERRQFDDIFQCSTVPGVVMGWWVTGNSSCLAEEHFPLYH